jgi:hypothetical protein
MSHQGSNVQLLLHNCNALLLHHLESVLYCFELFSNSASALPNIFEHHQLCALILCKLAFQSNDLHQWSGGTWSRLSLYNVHNSNPIHFFISYLIFSWFQTHASQLEQCGGLLQTQSRGSTGFSLVRYPNCRHHHSRPFQTWWWTVDTILADCARTTEVSSHCRLDFS